MFDLSPELKELRPRISVIGVGGAGGNAVANMIRSGVAGVEFIAANTDAQALRDSPADKILQLGRTTTAGLGAGSRAELGRAAAEESAADIERALDGAHMCFIAAGLGGGTGTGAAPVIARIAREKGILTVAVVTKPFAFEGSRRNRAAELGLAELAASVDTLIVIPNQNLFRVATAATTFKAAFDLADEVLQQGVRGITDLMVMPGMINLDFADIRTIMAGMGRAMLGTGEASGDGRALRAAELAISNPLLAEALKGARGLIISISGADDMLLMEVDEIASYVREMVDPEADIIWGSAFNQSLAGRIRVSVVATGIDAGQAIGETVPTERPPQATPAPSFPGFRALVQQPAAPRPVERAPVAHACAQRDLLDLVRPAPASTGADAGELLLTAPARLVLTPPDDAAELTLVDPFSVTAVAEDRAAAIAALRSPSLFERMATVARAKIRSGDAGAAASFPPKLPQSHSEPRFARAA